MADPRKAYFRQLKSRIKDLLDLHNETLKEREPPTISLEPFTVAGNEELCCPTLVVICAEESLKKVVEPIQESKILNDHEGVFLATASDDPRYCGTVQSTASGGGGEIGVNNTWGEGLLAIRIGIDRWHVSLCPNG